MKRVRVQISSQPEPAVFIDGRDITDAVQDLTVTLSADRAECSLQLRADVEVDMPLEVHAAAPWWLDDVTADQLEAAALDGDYGSSIGEKILAFLRARSAGR